MSPSLPRPTLIGITPTWYCALLRYNEASAEKPGMLVGFISVTPFIPYPRMFLAHGHWCKTPYFHLI